MKYLGMNSISNLFSHQDSIIVEIRRLWPYITKRRRFQFGLLFVLMVLVSYAETFNIGALLLFLGMLTAPRLLMQHLSMLGALKKSFDAQSASTHTDAGIFTNGKSQSGTDPEQH